MLRLMPPSVRISAVLSSGRCNTIRITYRRGGLHMSIGLRMTAREKAELWRRWKAGETVATMARAMGRRESTLLAAVRKNGGIAPRVRCRSRLALTIAEREEISRGL